MKDFKEVTVDFDDKVAVQKGNEIWIINNDFKKVSVPLEFWTLEDHDIHAKIKLLGKNKFKILEFHDLFQFNCSHDTSNVVKLITLALKANGYDTSFVEKNMESPELVKESVISNSKIIQHPDFYSNPKKKKGEVEYEFNFKGKKILGYGTYIKYMFFDDIEKLPDSITELFLLTVDLHKLIGKACCEAKKDFLACDAWVKKLYL